MTKSSLLCVYFDTPREWGRGASLFRFLYGQGHRDIEDVHDSTSRGWGRLRCSYQG